MSDKQLLLTLEASVVLKTEAFLNTEPLTLDKIGKNWVAERLYEAHENSGRLFSVHKLDKTERIVTIAENDFRIVIDIRSE